MNRKLLVLANETEVIENLKKEIENAANEAISENGVFRCGLSGGSLVKYLSLALQNIQSDFSKWKLFFCDERFVDVEDEESTWGTYRRKLLSNGIFNKKQFVIINTNVTLEECAKDYEEKVLKEFQIEYGSIPRFDMLLLGMGPDGHTCSLYPGHPLLKVQDRLIVSISDSPKPPPKRITMTLPLVNNAKYCLFAACGSNKADMVKRVFADIDKTLPAALVSPEKGILIGLFDSEAGKYLE